MIGDLERSERVVEIWRGERREVVVVVVVWVW